MRIAYEQTIGVKEAQERRGCSHSTILRMIKKGVLRTTSRKPIRIVAADLDQFIEIQGNSKENYVTAKLGKLEAQVQELRATQNGFLAYIVGRAHRRENMEEELRALWHRGITMRAKTDWGLLEIAMLADSCCLRTSGDLMHLVAITKNKHAWRLLLELLIECQILVADKAKYSDDPSLSALLRKILGGIVRLEHAGMSFLFLHEPKTYMHLSDDVVKDIRDVPKLRVLRDERNIKI